jgi:hypothetical protein
VRYFIWTLTQTAVSVLDELSLAKVMVILYILSRIPVARLIHNFLADRLASLQAPLFRAGSLTLFEMNATYFFLRMLPTDIRY